MWKTVTRIGLGAALLIGGLVVAPQSASAGDWGAQVVEYNKDGRLERFMVSGDGQVSHQWETAKGSGNWSRWWSLGGEISSGLGVTHNQDGRLEIFGRARGGDLNHMYQLSPGGDWSGWYSLGGQITARTGVYANYYGNNGGTIRVQVEGIDNRTHFLWQLGPNCCWSSVWT